MKKKSKKVKAARVEQSNFYNHPDNSDVINGHYSYDSDESVFHLYLKEINMIPLLSKEEEEKIARQAVNGNNSQPRKRLCIG